MRRGFSLVGLALIAGAAVGQGDTFAFMPDGGRGILVRAFPDATAQREALSKARSIQD